MYLLKYEVKRFGQPSPCKMQFIGVWCEVDVDDLLVEEGCADLCLNPLWILTPFLDLDS